MPAPILRLAVGRLGALTAGCRSAWLAMCMLIGATLAAIALAVFMHSVLPQDTIAMRAGTGWI